MVRSTSGFRLSMSSINAFRSFQISGSRFSTSTKPMTLWSLISNSTSPPASRRQSPPIPKTSAVGSSCLMARVTAPACKSPEASPAEINTLTMIPLCNTGSTGNTGYAVHPTVRDYSRRSQYLPIFIHIKSSYYNIKKQLNKPFSCQFHKYFIFIIRFGFYFSFY